MRTDIHPDVVAVVEQHHTAPGYLILIDFPTPLRFSTRGHVEFDGEVWVPASVKVEGITFNTAGAQRGTLTFFDHDNSLAALLQHYGVADRLIAVLSFDAGAVEHPVGVFVGAGGKVSGDGKGGVVIEIANLKSRLTKLPRMYIAPEFGFHHIVPDGAVDKVGTTTHTWKVRR